MTAAASDVLGRPMWFELMTTDMEAALDEGTPPIHAELGDNLARIVGPSLAALVIAQDEKGWLATETMDFVAEVDNPWFPLSVGARWEYDDDTRVLTLSNIYSSAYLTKNRPKYSLNVLADRRDYELLQFVPGEAGEGDVRDLRRRALLPRRQRRPGCRHVRPATRPTHPRSDDVRDLRLPGDAGLRRRPSRRD